MLPGQMRGERCARRKLAPPFAQIGKAQDRVDQIIIGTKLERVHTGLPKRTAQFLLPAFGGCGKTLAKAAIVRIDENLLAGFGILNDEEAEIRQLHFQGVVQAHGNNFVAVESIIGQPNTPVLRQRTDAAGNWQFFLPANASVNVSPSVTSSGRAGDVTVNPPSG